MPLCGVCRKHFAQIGSSVRQMAGSWPNLHFMVSRRPFIEDVLKVGVKGHIWIPAHLEFHKNRLFCNMVPGFISLTPRRISRNVDASRSASNLLRPWRRQLLRHCHHDSTFAIRWSRYESFDGLGWWSCDVDDVECWVSCLSADVPWTAGRATSSSPSAVRWQRMSLLRFHHISGFVLVRVDIKF